MLNSLNELVKSSLWFEFRFIIDLALEFGTGNSSFSTFSEAEVKSIQVLDNNYEAFIS